MRDDTTASEAAAAPRAARRSNNLEAITVAAREIFVERGYHGASIRDIAARAGLSLSALYYWHESKQDLLAALLAESRRDYIDACQTALEDIPADEHAARLAALVEATVHYRVRRRAESALTAQEWKHLEPPHLANLDQYRVAAAAMWKDVVDGGVAAGVFRCAHPDDARRTIVAACNAIAQWYDPNGEVGVDKLAVRYVQIALRVVDHRPLDPPKSTTNTAKSKSPITRTR